MSPKMLGVAQEEVRKMSALGIIDRSDSNYCSAPVILRKRDGGHRTCIDYRPLNKVTKKDAYPLPNMDSILDKLRGAKYLSKIDLNAAYHQSPMAREREQEVYRFCCAGLDPNPEVVAIHTDAFRAHKSPYDDLSTADRLTFRPGVGTVCVRISRRYHNHHGDLRETSEMGRGSVKQISGRPPEGKSRKMRIFFFARHLFRIFD